MFDVATYFSTPFVVLPVVHVLTTTQAVEQAKVAHDAGAEGVFLINHGSSWRELGAAVEAVRSSVGGFVGANAIDLDALGVFRQLAREVGLDAVWCDNAGISEDDDVQVYAELVDAARGEFTGLYFGGVAFKHQRRVKDLELAAHKARPHMDVVCSSGPATNAPPGIDKVRTLVAGAGATPVALASGVSLANIAQLADAGARLFLVASSIERSFGELDPSATRSLVAAASCL